METMDSAPSNCTASNASIDSSCQNATLPPVLMFTTHSLVVIIVYCLFFLVAAIGNLTVFVTLSRARHRKSRISLMICHLAVADLLVTFFMIPLEVGWRITTEWVAGNLACKVLLFLRAFGVYLSSNILVCVSLDRYFAVLHPLKMNDARRRGKLMLAIAWICSVIYSVPQSFIFHVDTHPLYPEFQQCVTYGFFISELDEAAYNLFGILAVYFIPLIIICWVYFRILCEIISKSRETTIKSNSSGTLNSTDTSGSRSRLRLRRSDMSSIERARSRTLRMTITIVAVFILCWTPYAAMTLWYIIDSKSAKLVDIRLQDALFMMVVGNSCANPLVYGSYVVDFKKECCRCFGSNGSSSRTIIKRPILKAGQQKVEKVPPGVGTFLVLRVQRAVHDLLKVGSSQTRCTVVCAANLAPASSPEKTTPPPTTIPQRMSLCEMNSDIVKNFQGLQSNGTCAK